MLNARDIEIIINNPSKENLDAHYDAIRENIDYIDKSFLPIIANQINLSDKERIITDLFSRIRLWVHSVVLMNNKLCFQGIAAATRSIFELFIDINLIDRDSTGLCIKQYMTFSEVERFRSAQLMIQYQDIHPESKIGDFAKHLYSQPDKKIEIIGLIQNIWGKALNKKGELNYPRHWSKKDLRKRSQDLGTEYEELYLQVYPKMSWFIHSVPTGFERMNDFSNINFLMLCYLIIQKTLIESTIITGRIFKITEFDTAFIANTEALKGTAFKIILQKHSENNS